MARFQLPKPQSMYRDTGIVEITKELRNRYVANLKADDALAQSILEMDSMEQDDEMKVELVERYNQKLRERAAMGNYEMQGTAIQKDARSFLNEYHPIKMSKQQYDTWATELTKRYQEGHIDSETYNGKLEEAQYRYKGLKYKSDGTVDHDSIFSGPSYVNDVIVEEEIMKHMKDVVLSEMDTTGMEYMYDENMQILQGFNEETQSPAYYVKQGEYTKWLDPELVNNVVTSVLNMPHVRASIQQKAHLENYQKEQINPDTNETIATGEINTILANMDTKIDELESKAKLTEDEEAELDRMIRIEEDVKEALENNVNPVQLLTALSANEKQIGYLNNAIVKYAGVKSQKFVRDYTEGARFNIDYKQSIENPLIKYVTGAEGLVVDVLGGRTINEKNSYLVAAETSLTNAMDTYGEEFITAALNANTEAAYDELLKLNPNLDRQEVIRISKEVQAHSTMIDLVKTQMDDATAGALGVDPNEHNKKISNMYSNTAFQGSQENRGTLVADGRNVPYSVTGHDILEAMIALGHADENTSVKDALDILKSGGTSAIGGSRYGFAGSEYKLSSVIADYLKDKYVDTGVSDTPAWKGQDNRTINLTFAINNLMTSYDKDIKADNKKINTYLESQIKTDALVLTSFGDKTAKTAVAMRNFFEEGIRDDFSLIDENGENISYEEVRKDLTVSNKAPTVVKNKIGLVAVPRVDGKALIAIPLKDTTGKITTYYADASQLKIPGLDQYTTTLDFKVNSLYRKGIWANVNKWAPEIFEGTVLFDYAHAEGPKIFIAGVRYNEAEGLLELANILKRENASL